MVFENKVKKAVLKVLAMTLSLQGLFFFSALPAEAALLKGNGLPAIDVLGQYDSTRTDTLAPFFTKNGPNNGPNRLGFRINSSSIAIDNVNHRLFVVDSSNHRVLVFALNTDGSVASKVPVNVIGQTNYDSNSFGLTQSTMRDPEGIAYDGVHNRLFVGDSSNARVTVFNLTGGITDGMNASYVLGQPDFTTGTGAVTQSKLNLPVGITYDSANDRLFVAEFNFARRVLVYDVRPAGSSSSSLCGESTTGIANGMNASCVLGQANFTSSGAAVTATGMSQPQGIVYDATTQRLFVADRQVNRVLTFELAGGISNGMAATHVIGQVDLTSSATATSQTGLNNPVNVEIDSVGQRLFVSDNANNRVTVYDVATSTDGQAATKVLGQPDFTSSAINGGSATPTQSNFNSPRGIAYSASSTQIFVSEISNERVMVFDAATITNGEPAIDVLGQYDGNSTNPFNTTPSFIKGANNNGPNRWSFSISSTAGMTIDAVHHRLFVPDNGGHRVLVFNMTATDELEDYIADHVLGQPDFSTITANTQNVGNGCTTTPNACGLSGPRSVVYDPTGDRLFVTDNVNHRVSIFDVASITDGEPAISVLGQPDLTTNGTNTLNPGNGCTTTPSACGLNAPQGISLDVAGQRLFVADINNQRVLVFNVASVTAGEPAVNVFGQPNLNSAAGGVGATSFSNPRGVVYDSVHNRIYTVESSGRRVLVFDVSTITNGQAATNVIGQPDFLTSTANTQNAGNGCTTSINACGLFFPNSLAYDTASGALYVADTSNSRVMVFDVNAVVDGEAAVNVLGQPDFTTGTLATTQVGTDQPFGFAVDAVNRRLYVWESATRATVFDVATSTGTVTPTRDNRVMLSNYAASATATANISFQLMHVLSSQLVVSFPAGFTVMSAATALASSPCFSGFGFTASTLTATKTNCAGPITLGGATVTNPSNGGVHTISWVNDDPGNANVTITGGGGGGGGSPPSVTVTQPNGGETLSGSSTYQVVWSSGGSGISSYKLSSSTDAGASWSEIAAGLTANFYDWIVPNISTNSAKMKIEAQNGGSTVASDESNSVFTIAPTSTPPSTPPPSTPPPDSSTSTPPTSPPPEPTPPPHDFVPTQEAAKAPSIDDEKELAPAANPACAPGALIRGSRSTVYYCGKDGKRYPFPNAKTFFTWYPDFSQVQRVPDTVLSQTQVGAYVTYKPGVKMVKITTDAKTYGVAEGGIIRHVPTETVARDLYGTDWNQKIDDIPLVFWGGYKLGPPIN